MRSIDWSALEGLGTTVAAALEPVLGGSSAERALDRLLRAHRSFTAAQRTAAAWALFGVALWRRRLLAELGIPWREETANRDLPALASALLFALLHRLAGVEEALARAWSGFAHAASPITDEPRSRTSLSPADVYSLPDWLWDALVRELPAGEDGSTAEKEAARFADAISRPGPIFLRANRLRCTRDELLHALAREGIDAEFCEHTSDGLRVISDRPNLLVCQSFRSGLFEVQDEGSQLLGALVEARAGDRVLDLCAGAGGKSLQLAAAVGPSGRVVCSDIDGAKLARLRTRALRAGASCIEIASEDRLRAEADRSFDRVLVDAPCSELGSLRRGPDARWRIDRAALETWPALQLELLLRAATFVRPGGRLVYATCTLRREENQEVATALDRAGSGSNEFSRIRPGAGFLADSFIREGNFTALPHLHGTDGFFAAVWQRR